jgi:hypothetical protein
VLFLVEKFWKVGDVKLIIRVAEDIARKVAGLPLQNISNIDVTVKSIREQGWATQALVDLNFLMVAGKVLANSAVKSTLPKEVVANVCEIVNNRSKISSRHTVFFAGLPGQHNHCKDAWADMCKLHKDLSEQGALVEIDSPKLVAELNPVLVEIAAAVEKGAAHAYNAVAELLDQHTASLTQLALCYRREDTDPAVQELGESFRDQLLRAADTTLEHFQLLEELVAQQVVDGRFQQLSPPAESPPPVVDPSAAPDGQAAESPLLQDGTPPAQNEEEDEEEEEGGALLPADVAMFFSTLFKMLTHFETDADELIIQAEALVNLQLSILGLSQVQLLIAKSASLTSGRTCK